MVATPNEPDIIKWRFAFFKPLTRSGDFTVICESSLESVGYESRVSRLVWLKTEHSIIQVSSKNLQCVEEKYETQSESHLPRTCAYTRWNLRIFGEGVWPLFKNALLARRGYSLIKTKGKPRENNFLQALGPSSRLISQVLASHFLGRLFLQHPQDPGQKKEVHAQKAETKSWPMNRHQPA